MANPALSHLALWFFSSSAMRCACPWHRCSHDGDTRRHGDQDDGVTLLLVLTGLVVVPPPVVSLLRTILGLSLPSYLFSLRVSMAPSPRSSCSWPSSALTSMSMAWQHRTLPENRGDVIGDNLNFFAFGSSLSNFIRHQDQVQEQNQNLLA